jgi:hypothetical protein
MASSCESPDGHKTRTACGRRHQLPRESNQAGDAIVAVAAQRLERDCRRSPPRRAVGHRSQIFPENVSSQFRPGPQNAQGTLRSCPAVPSSRHGGQGTAAKAVAKPVPLSHVPGAQQVGQPRRMGGARPSSPLGEIGSRDTHQHPRRGVSIGTSTLRGAARDSGRRRLPLCYRRGSGQEQIRSARSFLDAVDESSGCRVGFISL